MIIPACNYQYRNILWFLSCKGSKVKTMNYRLFYLRSDFENFKILCNIVSKSAVVYIMNCKSLCLSVSKTNFASILGPTGQGSTTAVVPCCARRSFLMRANVITIFLIMTPIYPYPRCNGRGRFGAVKPIFKLPFRLKCMYQARTIAVPAS